jgi:hypothetical protein
MSDTLRSSCQLSRICISDLWIYCKISQSETKAEATKQASGIKRSGRERGKRSLKTLFKNCAHAEDCNHKFGSQKLL